MHTAQHIVVTMDGRMDGRTDCLLLTSPEAPGKVVGRLSEALVDLGVALVARVDEVC